MKERASFTFDKETIDILNEIMKSSKYRNKSHIVEEAIRTLGENELRKEEEENE